MQTIRAALLVGLSLSIGWGVRGNFGHEYGAMLPGALAALAGVLVLGRREWLPRMAYFGFCGALGWAFGGSISYMQVISYTHSGHLPSVIYGYGGLLVIGFLWAAMGGLAVTLTAEASGRRLSTLFRPLMWIVTVWIGLHFVLIWLAQFEARYIDDRTWQRQASGLYWMDSDWIQVLTAGLALVAFELYDSRFRHWSKWLLLAGGGALAGWLVQMLLTATGVLPRLLVWPLVQYQADAALIARLAEERGQAIEQIHADLLTNWPNWFSLFPQHVGWVIGLLIGVVIYCLRFGRFRSGSGLLMSMVVGWYIGFVLMPVLLGFGGAGLRMTPPRGDNWAGIVGVVVATVWWMLRHGYSRAAYAGLLCGLVGGLGFAGATLLKLLMLALGNPNLTSDPTVIERWRFWQHSNWHSFLEQSYGLINGLGLFLALYWLRNRPPRFARDSRTEPSLWRHIIAIAGLLFGVIFLNMQKNVQTWVELKAVPESLRLPGFENINLSAYSWFCLGFLALTCCGIGLLRSHLRRPLDWMPTHWLGRGQLLYLVFLWIVVVMNFERALVRFSEGRLLTEGTIFLNAILVTWMVSRWPPAANDPSRARNIAALHPNQSVNWLKMTGLATAVLAMCLLVMPAITRQVYGATFAGHANQQKRFGSDALWRTTPIFKSKRHS
ncbi:MAG: hypothetical protein KF752_01225 [Pirellulaceae bacterium]|nr:hypothetical protein [Pirellulaceae bacterium]